ncbi:unnamed protein product [Arabis nemorensis]|uniref:C2H2-type domain-containing protein n=1 Tax=Arabis nemorensis TaxID=586526 RepID=A0A565BCQ2_9BRAS|nr:unnamed protein product [Arabis nemorensis]
MEFRYRAVDGDRPSTATVTASSQPSNPTFSFFSTRPMLGCNITGSSEEDHVRETIQREIEKEQIRQEITVAETLRRRELIAEVMQEMAVEREMAIRRVAETMGRNQRNNNLYRQNCTYRDHVMYTFPNYSLLTSPMMQMPETTPVLESNKDKLIVLNRADPVGAKRKAEDTQNGIERAKRSVGLDRESHFLGVEKKIMETVSSNLPCLGELGSGKQQQVESKSKTKFRFWCDVCSVGAFTQTVMRDHELGKKHIAAIKQQNKPHETASASISFITAPASATAPPQTKAITEHQTADVQDREVAAKETGKKTEGGIYGCFKEKVGFEARGSLTFVYFLQF